MIDCSKPWTAVVVLAWSICAASLSEAQQRDHYLSELRWAQSEAATQPDMAEPGNDRPTPSRPNPSRPDASRPDSTQADPPRPAFNLLRSGAPNMFGDFFGGTGGFVAFAPQPVTINQIWTDGNPVDLFVTNGNQGFGASFDPNVPIFISQGRQGPPIAQSIGPGIDTNGDDQPDTYPISEPVGSSPGTGFVYDGGNANFPGDPANPGAPGPIDSGDGWMLTFSHTQGGGGEPVMILIPPGGGLSVRRIKLAENNSPQPRDRIFFNYNFFNNVIGGIGDVNRYNFGIERTFRDGLCSLEFRLPFASTLGSDQLSTGGQLKDTELGNATVICKRILYQNNGGLIAGGLGFTIPMSDDTRVFTPMGQQVLRWDSDSVHLLPYLAVLSTPTESCFWQAFWQFDIDPSGNNVAGNFAGGPLQRLGNIQDSTLMFIDIGAGFHVYDNPGSGGIETATALAELHYATTLQDADLITGDNLVIGTTPRRYDVLNLTLGVNFLTGNGISIRPAMVIPLRDGTDQQFDYEAQVQVNVQL